MRLIDAVMLAILLLGIAVGLWLLVDAMGRASP